MSAAATQKTETIDWPLWWFARLELAIETGNYAAAAKAQRELDRLGVEVRYRGRYAVQKEIPAPSG